LRLNSGPSRFDTALLAQADYLRKVRPLQNRPDGTSHQLEKYDEGLPDPFEFAGFPRDISLEIGNGLPTELISAVVVPCLVDGIFDD
jgi:hypothetical protein